MTYIAVTYLFLDFELLEDKIHIHFISITLHLTLESEPYMVTIKDCWVRDDPKGIPILTENLLWSNKAVSLREFRTYSIRQGLSVDSFDRLIKFSNSVVLPYVESQTEKSKMLQFWNWRVFGWIPILSLVTMALDKWLYILKPQFPCL